MPVFVRVFCVANRRCWKVYRRIAAVLWFAILCGYEGKDGRRERPLLGRGLLSWEAGGGGLEVVPRKRLDTSVLRSTGSLVPSKCDTFMSLSFIH